MAPDAAKGHLGVLEGIFGQPGRKSLRGYEKSWNQRTAKMSTKTSTQTCATQHSYKYEYPEVVGAQGRAGNGPQGARGPTEGRPSPVVAPFFAGVSQSNSTSVDSKLNMLSGGAIS